MLKRYRIKLPNKEMCSVMGIKFDGNDLRTQLWLMGLASGVSFMAPHVPIERATVKFNAMFTNRTTYYVETNSQTLIEQVEDYLSNYGCTVEEVLTSAFAVEATRKGNAAWPKA